MNSKGQNGIRPLENYDPVDVVYDALATEMILPRLDDFAPSIQWCDQFKELDQSTQTELKKIDQQIQQFTGLKFLSELTS